MRGIVIERARIQVDAEATRAYYDAYGKIAGGCGWPIAGILQPQ